MARSDIDPLADSLAELYRAAWADVVEEQARIAADPTRFRRRARLREIQRRIESRMADLDDAARQWLNTVFPRTYERGSLDLASSIGAEFAWTQADLDAVTSLAGDLFDELLDATRFTRRSTKRLIREVSRAVTRPGVVTGRTAEQIADQVTRIVRDRGIHSVVYRNGARVGLSTYAQMAIRTKTAVAYNTGALLQARRHGVRFLEVFDGAACGWSAHNDPEAANGKIVTLDQSFEFPLAHPQCRRSFGARPDITNPTEQAGARPSTTEAQRIDQAAAERTRAARLERRRRRRALRAQRRR